MSPKEIIQMWWRSHVEMWKDWKSPIFWIAWGVATVLVYLVLGKSW